MIDNVEQNKSNVSVGVITYNSAYFIIETLDSIYHQTYDGDIELIISDDHSTDNTIDLVNKWMYNHKSRFIRVFVQESSINTGIPENCNRCLENCTGKWIKLISGDDALELDFLSVMIDFVENYDLNVAYCNLTHYKQTFVKENQLSIKQRRSYFKSKEITAKEQYKILLRVNPVLSPCLIIKKQVFDEISNYSNKYKCCDDWPLLIKMSSLGYKINYIEYNGVKYRKHNHSIELRSNTEIISKFEESKYNVILDFCMMHYSWPVKIFIHVYYTLKIRLSTRYNNKIPNIFIALILYLLDFIFNLFNNLRLKLYIIWESEFMRFFRNYKIIEK